MLCLVALMAVACNQTKDSDAPTIVKAEENPDANAGDATAGGEDGPIFREEEPEGGWPDGLPPTLAAIINKQYKYQEKRANGMRYLEMQFYSDHLLLKSQLNQPFWDRFEFELHGDTIFPHKLNKETGELESTGDFFIIHRVWGDDVDITSYDMSDPTKKSEIPFKRVTSVPDPREQEPPTLPKK